jgi:hypothetical protein
MQFFGADAPRRTIAGTFRRGSQDLPIARLLNGQLSKSLTGAPT